MNEKRNYFWVEEENTAGCECCAMYSYHVYGFDHEGKWAEYGPYSYRDLAEEKRDELEQVSNV